MTPELSGVTLLSAMITPAVLISACGTLIFSTSTRLARVVDRVRHLSSEAEGLDPTAEGADERVHQMERQLGYYARRSRLVQGALTTFYVALGLFVASTVTIGLTPFVANVAWVPGALGIVGTLVLFAGSVLLISETRLALISLEEEMDVTMDHVERTLGHRRRQAVSSVQAQGASPEAEVASVRAAVRKRALDSADGPSYVAAGSTALIGLVVWVAVARLTHVAEAWDSPHFYRIAVPLLAFVSAATGFLRPRGAGWWGVTTLALVPAAVLIVNARSRTPLAVVDVLVLGALAASLTIFSLLGAGTRWAIPPRR